SWNPHSILPLVDWRTREHHRNFDLPIQDVPVRVEERNLARGRDQLEAVAPVKADCPICGFPSANQDAPPAQLPQMLEQSTAHTAPLAAWQDVSMTNEIDIAHRLDAHHPGQPPVLLIAPEGDTGSDLAIKLVPRHVGLVPPIGRDHTTIGLGSGVDD